jgi:hypothetical protein
MVHGQLLKPVSRLSCTANNELTFSEKQKIPTFPFSFAKDADENKFPRHAPTVSERASDLVIFVWRK